MSAGTEQIHYGCRASCGRLHGPALLSPVPGDEPALVLLMKELDAVCGDRQRLFRTTEISISAADNVAGGQGAGLQLTHRCRNKTTELAHIVLMV